MVPIFMKLGRHLIDRQDMTDQTGRCGAAGHPAHRHMVDFGLSDRQPPAFFDRLKAEVAVCSGPRKDDANRVLALVVRQREEERVDWPPTFSGRSRARQLRDAGL